MQTLAHCSASGLLLAASVLGWIMMWRLISLVIVQSVAVFPM